MNSIFSDILNKNLLVYLDGLLIFSADIELHYDDTYKKYGMIAWKMLKTWGSKCKFTVIKVEYLGHIVENGTVAMDPLKICSLVDWPVLILVKQI